MGHISVKLDKILQLSTRFMHILHLCWELQQGDWVREVKGRFGKHVRGQV